VSQGKGKRISMRRNRFMVNSSNLNLGKSENSQRLSDLLDNRCDSNDFDELLADADTKNAWYRYQTVSSILRNEHSAQESHSFCQEISVKLADEPAIIAAPASNKRLASPKSSKLRSDISPIRRFSGGLAIAASAAFATFFSVQTIQLSDSNQASSSPQQSIAGTVDEDSNPKISVEVSDSLEQTELEFSSDLYEFGTLRSGIISKQQVSGSWVKTIRFSAEQWQEMLDRAIEQRAKKEAVRLDSDSNRLKSEIISKEEN